MGTRIVKRKAGSGLKVGKIEFKIRLEKAKPSKEIKKE